MGATTIIVSGAVANKHRSGGAVWTRLSWALGLRKLGARVVFVEQLDPAHATDEAGRPTAAEESVQRAAFEAVMARVGLADDCALLAGTEAVIGGMGRPELQDLAGEADLLVNITGHLDADWLFGRVRRRAYVDLDPGYTQIWRALGLPGTRLDGHDSFFTVGANIGRPRCSIPTGGIAWRRVRQPVVLEDWPVSADGETDRFTTVASWRGPYGALEWNGHRYGLKVHEFRKVMDLPTLAPGRFEIALDIHPADREDRDALEAAGWLVRDPTAACGDPDAFRRYVQTSGAEFSVAQGIYVETRSGWFSDRTVRYLASGKPALVQDTGFSDELPVGAGLLPFRSLDEAVAGAESIRTDYRGHCEAARALAEEYFDSSLVLGGFLDEALSVPRRSFGTSRRASVAG